MSARRAEGPKETSRFHEVRFVKAAGSLGTTWLGPKSEGSPGTQLQFSVFRDLSSRC